MWVIRLGVGVLLGLAVAFLILVGYPAPAAGAQASGTEHHVEPGDTWAALAYRYTLAPETLRNANPHVNPYREPTIGRNITLPPAASLEAKGQIVRPYAGLVRAAASFGANPWTVALINKQRHPFQPAFGRAMFVPGGEEPPRDLPADFLELTFAQAPASPGTAIAFRGIVKTSAAVSAHLDRLPFTIMNNGERVVGLVGTGAFFYPGAPEFSVSIQGRRYWSQPFALERGSWDFDQVTLTGAAAAIDQEAIAEERARLNGLWSRVTPGPQWQQPFALPIDNYIDVSSRYGARRSYNGGPYSTYHEGVDFSAYGGTPVYAPAAGTVVLAEELYVRGGAVIIDHGLGVFSGYYHMSEVHVNAGDEVLPRTLLGAVGSKGLSSGNHLHWDFLVGGVWVDAIAWMEHGLDCWILEAWGASCPLAHSIARGTADPG